ncbi:UDP-4-amino-4,6-dideoxy-N-acetyl-beta-L-altrosamine transaminase [Candidatus Falkowbacteria bacterium]|nr:UDP-4-amino-4,6-dideoxy-N-acetyl-beta-L-altrosamine transaminase [Candidatus Falkowbacteria bacterium]
MDKIIPYGKQFIDNSDVNFAIEVIRSDWLTQGPRVKEFENAFAEYCGVKFAIAVSSGTAALHLAALAAGFEYGDEAITTPISFVATANCLLYVGAKPIFADIDYNNINIDPKQIQNKITEKTKAVIPVHFAGLPADLPSIYETAQKNKLIVIEDACHALGADYFADGKWHKVGSCEHSDMAVFSFHPVKLMTTGEGGMITTNGEKLYEKLCALRSHGIYKDEETAAEGAWCYDMRELGFNYRLTDFQCALGISQLKKVGLFLNRRRMIAERYNEAFAELQPRIKLPFYDLGKYNPAWHLYILRLADDYLISKRRQIFDELHEKNIKVQIHYRPINRNSYYQKLGYDAEKYINADRYYSECVSLPIYYSLTDDEQGYLIENVKSIIKKFC